MKARVDIQAHRVRPIPAEGVRALYRNADWWPQRTEAEIAAVLDASPAVGAWDGERLVGFARAVTDGKFRAYVEDVVVHDDYRRQGIGEQVVARLMEELSHIDVVSLFCQGELTAFYGRSRFKPTTQVVMHGKA